MIGALLLGAAIGFIAGLAFGTALHWQQRRKIASLRAKLKLEGVWAEMVEQRRYGDAGVLAFLKAGTADQREVAA